MRESLGIVLDSTSISTALVDADTPLLGSIDEFRHGWGEDGGVPTAQSSARALASAADVAIERAARSDMQPTVIGVLCERADVRDLIPQTLPAQAFGAVVVVNGLDARLAYLSAVDALAGVSPILAFWPEGTETVIAAIDLRAGAIESAHRYISAELLASSATFTATLDTIVVQQNPVPKMLVAMGIPEQDYELSATAAERSGLGFLFLGERAQLAIGTALVAAARPAPATASPVPGVFGGAGEAVPTAAASRRWAPLVLLSVLLVLGGLLIGLLSVLAPDNARTATTDRSNTDTPPAQPGGEHRPESSHGERRSGSDASASESAIPGPAGQGGGGVGEGTGPSPQVPPLPAESLRPCDPVVPAAPARLRRSDPDLPTTSPTQTPEAEPCTPTRNG